MSQYLIDRIQKSKNIEVLPNTRVTGVSGEARLGSVTLTNAGGEETEVATCGLFIFIGTAPKTHVVSGLVRLDEQGFICTGADLMRDGKRPNDWTADRDPLPFETSVPGIFAAGDARERFGKARGLRGW